MSPPGTRGPGVGDADARVPDDELDRATRLELLEAGAQMLHVGTWDRELARDQSYWSVEMRRIYGVEAQPGPFSKEALLSMVHPDDRSIVGATIRDLSERPRLEPVQLRHRLLRPTGELRWVESRVRVVTDAEGKATRLLGVTIDRTELHSAEERARESERLAQTAMEQAADAIFIADPGGRYVEVNSAACRMLGYTREELLGTHVREVAPLELNEGQAPALELLRASRSLRTVRRLRRKDGSIVVGAFAAQILSDGRMAAIVRDVTEQTRAEAALREREAHYRNLFENAQVALFRTRIDGGLPLDVNRRFCELVGDTRERVLARPGVSWWVDLAERKEFARRVREHGRVEGLEGAIVDARGERWSVLATATLYPELGTIEGSIVDVTERTRQEAALRASLREKEVLLQEVHHRVKNNLQLVSSLLNLQASREADPRLKELLRVSQDRVAAMALVHQSLYQAGDFSRVAFARHCQAIVESICRSHGVPLSAVTLEAKAEVLVPLDTAVPLGLVLNELVTNALHHAYGTGPLGPIHVALRSTPDGVCRMAVRDEGEGLPGTDGPRASSLGLSLVEKLVEQFGGRLACRSEPGKGAAWEIEAALPFQSVTPIPRALPRW